MRVPHPSILPLTGLVLCACQLSPSGRPERVSTLQDSITELEVQALVMQMADEYDAALGEATYLVLKKGEVDSTGRWLAESFLRNGMGAALDVASGPNPDVGLLDLLVLGTLQTWAFEEHWISAGIDPEAGSLALERLKRAEESLWEASRRVLSRDQIDSLRGLIDGWIAEHPDQTVVAFVRFDDFTDHRNESTTGKRQEASGLLQDVRSATVAVEDARLLGERILWFASRYPYLLGQQLELTMYRLADQDEVREAREALKAMGQSSSTMAEFGDRLERTLEDAFLQLRNERTQAVEQLGQELRATADESLVDLFEGAEQLRTSSIEQLFDSLRQEAERLISDFDSVAGSLDATLAEAHATALATNEAGRTWIETAEGLDRLVMHFDRDPAKERPPLRWEDLRDTATELRLAAETMNEVLASTAALEPEELEKPLAAADAALTALADALFLRAGALIALLLVGLGLLRLLPRRAS